MSFSHLYHDITASKTNQTDDSLKIPKRSLDKLLKSKHIVLDNPGRTGLTAKKRLFPGFSRSSFGDISLDTLKSLNSVWENYIVAVLSTIPAASLCEHFLRCDFHGAYITVVRSKCISSIGKMGTIVSESKNTITVVTDDGKIRVIQKSGLVFSVKIAKMAILHIYGVQLTSSASSRSSKKIKWKPVA